MMTHYTPIKAPLVIGTLIVGALFMGAYSEHALSNESAESPDAENQLEHTSLDERFSYAYGVELAEKFKAEGINLNVSILAKAMQDVFDGGELKMSLGEVAATTQLYEELHYKKKEAERAVLGEKNKQEGEAFLAENAKKKGIVVTDSGLQYKIITKGNGGDKPTIEDEVTVHYRGTFIDGTEFDSTYKRNEAYSVKVKQLIKGWSEALQLMSEGAKWELYIPSDIAYGEKGSDQYVGPNAVLAFEVELLKIKKSEAM